MKFGTGWQHNDQCHPFEPEAGGEGHKPDQDACEPGFGSFQVRNLEWIKKKLMTPLFIKKINDPPL